MVVLEDFKYFYFRHINKTVGQYDQKSFLSRCPHKTFSVSSDQDIKGCPVNLHPVPSVKSNVPRKCLQPNSSCDYFSFYLLVV